MGLGIERLRRTLPKLRRGEWTAADLMRLRDEYLRGRPASAIALLLGRTVPSIKAQIDLMGLPAAPRRRWGKRMRSMPQQPKDP